MNRTELIVIIVAVIALIAVLAARGGPRVTEIDRTRTREKDDEDGNK
jgi:Tfp pilus assembly protein FimT